MQQNLACVVLFSLAVCLQQLQGKSAVIDISARSNEAAHIPALLSVWHQFKFVGLQSFHALIILEPMDTNNDIRHTRHPRFSHDVIRKYIEQQQTPDSFLRYSSVSWTTRFFARPDKKHRMHLQKE